MLKKIIIYKQHTKMNTIEQIISLDETEQKLDIEFYNVISNDDHEFLINKEHLYASKLFLVIFEDKESKEIKINLPAKTFGFILTYLSELYNNKNFSIIPKPIMDKTLVSYLNEWELNYLDLLMSEKMLKKVLEAANYLDISSLFEMCCAKVASLIKGKINSPEFDKIIESIDDTVISK
jgi:S-phase kinase-associated protein 1